MNITTFFRRSMLLLVSVALCGGLFAQETKEEKKPEKKPKDGSFWLDLNTGIGGTTSFDKSTIPFAYTGLLLQLQAGFTYDWKRCHIQFETTGNTTLYDPLFGEPVKGSGNVYSGNFEFLYSCLNPSVKRWHFWSGASVNGIFDLKQISDLQNAANTISLFHELSAVELVQCDFAYDKTIPTRPWLTAFFKFSLPLYALCSRPQFAYVQDITDESDIIGALFRNNETVFKFFPGCSVNLGLMLNLRNGNRIGLSYGWDYLSTGKAGAYRYDNAFHSVKLSFKFKI